MYFPISTLLRTAAELQSFLVLFERIFDYLDIRPEIVDAPDTVTIPPARVRAAVELHNVHINYRRASKLSGETLCGDAAAGCDGHDTALTPMPTPGPWLP